MTVNKMQAQLIGKELPMETGRTDEGTPVSLYDFRGRAMAVFLSGKGVTGKNSDFVRHLKEATPDFLKYECSPVWVSADEEEILAASREMYDLPFMIISDFSKEIHSDLGYDFDRNGIDVWIADDSAKIVYALPSMEPVELINATISALERVFAGHSRK